MGGRGASYNAVQKHKTSNDDNPFDFKNDSKNDFVDDKETQYKNEMFHSCCVCERQHPNARIKKESVELISLFSWRFWNTLSRINNTPHPYWKYGAKRMPT